MRPKVLIVPHSSRPVDWLSGSWNLLTRRYGDLRRLQNVPPVDQLTYAAGIPDDDSARRLHQAIHGIGEAWR